jgi:hypothetical protein
LSRQEKLSAYLLNAAHPDNGGKAAFFLSLGFSREDWSTLAAALRDLASRSEIGETFASPHGQKYVLIGRIQTPSGRRRSCRQFGSLTAEKKCHDWSPHIHMRNNR